MVLSFLELNMPVFIVGQSNAKEKYHTVDFHFTTLFG